LSFGKACLQALLEVRVIIAQRLDKMIKKTG